MFLMAELKISPITEKWALAESFTTVGGRTRDIFSDISASDAQNSELKVCSCLIPSGSTIRTLTTVSFLPVSGTVATSEPQGSEDCCASADTEKFTFPETNSPES